MSLLIAFSGQGMQHKEMFNFLKSNEQGKKWLQDASDIIHKDLLDENVVAQYQYDILDAQLFIVLLSVGVFKLLESQVLKSQNPDFFSTDLLLCGYSLGEISAFCVSAELSLEEIVDVVEKRAHFMQEVAQKLSNNQPCGLAVLKGHINEKLAQDLVGRHECYVAIINDKDHYIIGGLKKQLDALLEEAKKNGVDKAECLRVNVPSHTPILIDATQNFLNYLQTYKENPLRYSILNALTAEKITTSREIIPILSNELSQTLHWQNVMSIAQEYNINSFLELGPKASLKNMAQNYFQKTYALEDFSTVEGMLKILLSEL